MSDHKFDDMVRELLSSVPRHELDVADVVGVIQKAVITETNRCAALVTKSITECVMGAFAAAASGDKEEAARLDAVAGACQRLAVSIRGAVPATEFCGFKWQVNNHGTVAMCTLPPLHTTDHSCGGKYIHPLGTANKNPHLGSTLSSFIEEMGILKSVEANVAADVAKHEYKMSEIMWKDGKKGAVGTIYRNWAINIWPDYETETLTIQVSNDNWTGIARRVANDAGMAEAIKQVKKEAVEFVEKMYR